MTDIEAKGGQNWPLPEAPQYWMWGTTQTVWGQSSGRQHLEASRESCCETWDHLVWFCFKRIFSPCKRNGEPEGPGVPATRAPWTGGGWRVRGSWQCLPRAGSPKPHLKEQDWRGVLTEGWADHWLVCPGWCLPPGSHVHTLKPQPPMW